MQIRSKFDASGCVFSFESFHLGGKIRKETFPCEKCQRTTMHTCHNVQTSRVPWAGLKEGSRIHARREGQNGGFLSLLYPKAVRRRHERLRIAGNATKTPAARQGLANITRQQCADRHHATRLLFRDAYRSDLRERYTETPARRTPRRRLRSRDQNNFGQ